MTFTLPAGTDIPSSLATNKTFSVLVYSDLVSVGSTATLHTT